MMKNTPSLVQMASGKKPHTAAKMYSCIRKLTVKQLRGGRHRAKSITAARALLQEHGVNVQKVGDKIIVKALIAYLNLVSERYRNKIDGRQLAKVIVECLTKEGGDGKKD